MAISDPPIQPGFEPGRRFGRRGDSGRARSRRRRDAAENLRRLTERARTELAGNRLTGRVGRGGDRPA